MAHATLKTIAEYTGLSVTTVSRALKNGDDVKEPTNQKVREAAEKLGYAPNLQGLSLRTGRNYTIAAVVPVMKPGDVCGDISSLPLITGLTSGLKGTPYHVGVLPAEIGDNMLEPIRYVVESGLAGGLVFNLSKPNDPRVTYLSEHNFPFVCFGQTEMSVKHAFVDVDNFDASYRACEYLSKQGCKRIRMITSTKDYTYVWHKYYGMKRAAMEFGFEFSDDSLIYDSYSENYRKFAAQLLSKPDSPDGIFCGSEVSALGFLAGARDAGRTVGKDLHLICLEGCDLPSQYLPAVPGLRQDFIGIGEQLAKFLLRIIDGEDPSKLQEIRKVEFIPR